MNIRCGVAAVDFLGEAHMACVPDDEEPSLEVRCHRSKNTCLRRPFPVLEHWRILLGV